MAAYWRSNRQAAWPALTHPAAPGLSRSSAIPASEFAAQGTIQQLRVEEPRASWCVQAAAGRDALPNPQYQVERPTGVAVGNTNLHGTAGALCREKATTRINEPHPSTRDRAQRCMSSGETNNAAARQEERALPANHRAGATPIPWRLQAMANQATQLQANLEALCKNDRVRCPDVPMRHANRLTLATVAATRKTRTESTW
mmetsp:Transcript_15052/g.40387  ORF Transcript_15052/g.40387 Transcript_15052/m.40387 type:complete len:201 (-) Transcript_15052:3265-3867(-)